MTHARLTTNVGWIDNRLLTFYGAYRLSYFSMKKVTIIKTVEKKMLPSLISRNVVVAGQRTSFRLEPEMWSALDLICQQEQTDVHSLCTWISTYKPRSNRTSAIRAFIVSYLRAQIDGVQINTTQDNKNPIQDQDDMSEGLRHLFRAAG